MIIKEIKDGDRILRLNEAIMVAITICNRTGRFSYDNEYLNIQVTAYSIDDLLSRISEEIVFMWDTYVLNLGNCDLTIQAKRLSARLKKAITEVKEDE